MTGKNVKMFWENSLKFRSKEKKMKIFQRNVGKLCVNFEDNCGKKISGKTVVLPSQVKTTTFRILCFLYSDVGLSKLITYSNYAPKCEGFKVGGFPSPLS